MRDNDALRPALTYRVSLSDGSPEPEIYPALALLGEFPFPHYLQHPYCLQSERARTPIDRIRSSPAEHRRLVLAPSEAMPGEEFDPRRLASVGLLVTLDDVQDEMIDGSPAYICHFKDYAPVQILNIRWKGLEVEVTTSRFDNSDIRDFIGPDGTGSFAQLHPIIADTIELFTKFKQTLSPFEGDDYDDAPEIIFDLLTCGESFRFVTDLIAYHSCMSFKQKEELFYEEDLLLRYFLLNAHFCEQLRVGPKNWPPFENLAESGRDISQHTGLPADSELSDEALIFSPERSKNVSFQIAVEALLREIS